MRRACMLLAVAAATAVPGPARADRISWHGLISGDVAVTDNEFAVPSGENPEADAFLQIRPGLLFSQEGPRMINEVLAQVELLEYARHADEPTYSAYGSWKGVFYPTPRTEVTSVVDGAAGKVNSLSAGTPADQAVIQITPIGPSSVVSADANENMRYEVSHELRLTQTAFARYAGTSDEQAMPTTTASAEFGLGFGLQRVFMHDTVGVDVGASFLILHRLAPAGDLEGDHLVHQLNPRATLTWIHDFNREWSLNLQVGGLYLNPVGTDPDASTMTDQPSKLYPFGSALLGWTRLWGRATLQAGRSVAPDLYIAQNTITDSAILQAALPLDWLDEYKHAHQAKLALVGTVGVDHSQLLDSETGGTLGTFYLEHFDVGMTWARTQSQTFGVRLQVIEQNADTVGAMTEPSFHVETLFFTFALRYPNDVLSRPPPVGQSFRADRNDVSPVGLESVVPDGDDSGGGGGGGN